MLQFIHVYDLPNITVYVADVKSKFSIHELMRACSKARHDLIDGRTIPVTTYMVCLLLFAEEVLPMICKYSNQLELQINLCDLINNIRADIQKRSITYFEDTIFMFDAVDFTEEMCNHLKATKLSTKTYHVSQ